MSGCGNSLTSAPTRRADREKLRPLVDRYLEIAASPRQEQRKRLWADHFALRPTDRVPFSVYHEGMSGTAWEEVLGPDFLTTQGELAREIEGRLRKLLWLEEHVDDDTPKWASLVVACPARPDAGWGVPLTWRDPHVRDGARGYQPPLADRIDLKRLRRPEVIPDVEAGRQRQAEALELVDGRLAVHLRWPALGLAPFDVVVALRGMENVFLDVFDRPEELHALMDFVTTALVEDVKRREANGWLNVFVEDGGRYAQGPHRIRAFYPTGQPPTFADEWPYISAQTSAGLGPDQFAEFCHPYHLRLDALCQRPTVYFHGCECLDQKMDIIQGLPHLKHFHVSPWTNLDRAIARLRPGIIIEAHSHPGNVFFSFTPEQVREDVRAMLHRLQARPAGLYLSDIHAINRSPERLSWWAACAREFAAK